jgi:hypothetical protein
MYLPDTAIAETPLKCLSVKTLNVQTKNEELKSTSKQLNLSFVSGLSAITERSAFISVARLQQPPCAAGTVEGAPTFEPRILHSGMWKLSGRLRVDFSLKRSSPQGSTQHSSESRATSASSFNQQPILEWYKSAQFEVHGGTAPFFMAFRIRG